MEKSSISTNTGFQSLAGLFELEGRGVGIVQNSGCSVKLVKLCLSIREPFLWLSARLYRHLSHP